MNKLKMQSILGMVALVGAGFALASCGEESSTSEQATPASVENSNNPVLEGAPVPAPVVEEVQFDYCEIAEDKLDVKGDCEFVEFVYASGKAAAVKFGETYGLVTGEEEAKIINHANFFNYQEIVKTQAAASNVKVTDADFETAVVQLRPARGDYLLSVSFSGNVNGRVYVTNEGDVRGRLE